MSFLPAPSSIFALSWHANNTYYGIGVEIDLWLHAGFDVVANGSRAHLAQAQARYGEVLLPICLQSRRRCCASGWSSADGKTRRKSPSVWTRGAL
jgi:ribose 1,5-bisphosphokinase PhnN